jgi:hypothetical protein
LNRTRTDDIICEKFSVTLFTSIKRRRWLLTFNYSLETFLFHLTTQFSTTFVVFSLIQHSLAKERKKTKNDESPFFHHFNFSLGQSSRLETFLIIPKMRQNKVFKMKIKFFPLFIYFFYHKQDDKSNQQIKPSIAERKKWIHDPSSNWLFFELHWKLLKLEIDNFLHFFLSSTLQMTCVNH